VYNNRITLLQKYKFLYAAAKGRTLSARQLALLGEIVESYKAEWGFCARTCEWFGNQINCLPSHVCEDRQRLSDQGWITILKSTPLKIVPNWDKGGLSPTTSEYTPCKKSLEDRVTELEKRLSQDDSKNGTSPLRDNPNNSQDKARFQNKENNENTVIQNREKEVPPTSPLTSSSHTTTTSHNITSTNITGTTEVTEEEAPELPDPLPGNFEVLRASRFIVSQDCRPETRSETENKTETKEKTGDRIDTGGEMPVGISPPEGAPVGAPRGSSSSVVSSEDPPPEEPSPTVFQSLRSRRGLEERAPRAPYINPVPAPDPNEPSPAQRREAERKRICELLGQMAPSLKKHYEEQANHVLLKKPPVDLERLNRVSETRSKWIHFLDRVNKNQYFDFFKRAKLVQDKKQLKKATDKFFETRVRFNEGNRKFISDWISEDNALYRFRAYFKKWEKRYYGRHYVFYENPYLRDLREWEEEDDAYDYA
jgi:hypothetical protein